MPVVLGTKLRRVARFFGITDQEYQYWLGQVIVPIFDIAPYVRDPKTNSANGDLSPAVGTYVAILSVPANKRWTLRAASRGAVATTNTDLGVNYPGGSAMRVAEPPAALSAVAYTFNPFVLPPDASIGLYTTGVAGNTSIALNILYDEEDA